MTKTNTATPAKLNSGAWGARVPEGNVTEGDMCNHEATKTTRERCFTGGVAVSPYTAENRRAHGGVTMDEACSACGAERAVNTNGSHIEVGPWGPSAAERNREAAAIAVRRRAVIDRYAGQTVTMTCGSRSVRLTVAADGMIDLDGPHTDAEAAAIATSWPTAVAMARELRQIDGQS